MWQADWQQAAIAVFCCFITFILFLIKGHCLKTLNRWEKYLQMLLRKAEEQEKEDREHPEDKTKPKPAPEKEATKLSLKP